MWTCRFCAALLICLTTIASANARPARWCGWHARFNIVQSDPGEEFNQACAWRNYGAPASGPIVGVIVVWCSKSHRHVGKIVGGEPGHWIVKSGNDGGAVRTRERSVAGAIFRWP
jgi:hypothetical protein